MKPKAEIVPQRQIVCIARYIYTIGPNGTFVLTPTPIIKNNNDFGQCLAQIIEPI